MRPLLLIICIITLSIDPTAGQMNFCQESIPLSNAQVRMRFEDMLQKIEKKADPAGLFKRAQKYFPYVEAMLAIYGLPQDYKYLVVVETGYRNYLPNAWGAGGMWSLTVETARQLGLTVTNRIDERLDFVKATHAALKHIRSLYGELGSWTLAAAAYNGGLARIKKKVRQAGSRNYYQLSLCQETAEYVVKIMVIKELFEHDLKSHLVLQRLRLTAPATDAANKEAYTAFNAAAFKQQAGGGNETTGLSCILIGVQQGSVTVKIDAGEQSRVPEYITGTLIFDDSTYQIRIKYRQKLFVSHPLERLENGADITFKPILYETTSW